MKTPKEDVILRLAAGEMTREDFADWVERHLVPVNGFILGSPRK